MKSARSFKFAPFVCADADPLKAENVAIQRWLDDALNSADPAQWYKVAELKSSPGGQALLDAKPDEARRLVLAAIHLARHLNGETKRVRDQANSDMQRMNAHMLPGWSDVWGRSRHVVEMMATLLLRKLPLQDGDLIALLTWCCEVENLSSYSAPVGTITRVLEKFANDSEFSPELIQAIQNFAQRLRSSRDKAMKRLATKVEQLCPNMTAEESDATPIESRSVTPASSGRPEVLIQLKEFLGLAVPNEEAAFETIGPDRFSIRSDSQLRPEHELISGVLEAAVGSHGYHKPSLESSHHGQAILALDKHAMGLVVLSSVERAVGALFARPAIMDDHAIWQSQSGASNLPTSLFNRPFKVDRAGAFDLLLFISTRTAYYQKSITTALWQLVAQIEEDAQSSELTDGERYVLYLLRTSLIDGPLLGSAREDIVRLSKLIRDGAQFFVAPGEVWSDTVNEDLRQLTKAERESWIAALRHMLSATASRPTLKWIKNAEKLIAPIGTKAFADAICKWLLLVPKGRSLKRVSAYQMDARTAADTINDENANILRGLLWLIPTLKQDASEMARLISTVAMSAYKKVPGVGPRAVRVGNAAVYALSELHSTEAVGQLAMLKVRVKFGSAQKEIEKAFNSAAEALAIPRDQIEEMGVPTYGLEEVGLRTEIFCNGEFRAELCVDGRAATLSWLRSDGKPQKSLPAKVKSEHAEDVKELQTAVKDITAMLRAQNERLDAMFLRQTHWPIGVWRERYLDHALVGTLARRLIWCFTYDGRERTGIWLDAKIVNADDEALELPDSAEVRLWHPCGRPLDDTLTWRAWLERHQVRQPFKQAHREVYLLTDAERRTRTYSNRFAAHILRQHQFNALCAARGWKNKLRLMVDDSYPPAARELPEWNLRAEYWIEGAGDQYGGDTNESGVYLRVITDQVRFYRTVAAQNFAHATGGGYVAGATGPGEQAINEALPLDQIPALVLSEIMRDVDLFVGVASLGNDPAWQDGGPGGRYRTYWQNYSFGELSETARTRHDVLKTLLPRLSKIRERCSLDERFLIVRGNLRTYKIHLGSGNILMEPNDQYLCIVADRSAKSDGVFLPFEGDSTLSIILSKAFLLAEDSKIKDPTITRQIAGQ